MLTITQIDYIRKLYFDKGLSITEIEKCTAHARNTITKYINQDDFNNHKYNRTKDRKSDLVRPFVRQILLNDKENMKQHVTEPEALWTTYYRMTEDQSLYILQNDDTTFNIPDYTFKLENYDDLMGVGD